MLMDLCIVVNTILMSVPLSPNASTRPTSPMPRHFSIVDVVFAVSVNTIQFNVALRELDKCVLLGCCI